MTTITFKFSDQLPENVQEIASEHIKSVVSSFNAVKPERRVNLIPDSKLTGQKQGIIAIGKNAAGFAKSIRQRISTDVTVFVFQAKGYSDLHEKYKNQWNYYDLEHPIPDEKTFMTVRNFLKEVINLDKKTVIHFVATGGGSACFALPEKGIKPTQYIETIIRAMSAGFDIIELNYIRAMIDQVKGGKFASLLKEYQINTWAASDVINDDPRIIASGPTVGGIGGNPQTEEWLNQVSQNLNYEVDLDTLRSRLKHSNEVVSRNKDQFHTEVIVKRSDLLSILEQKLTESGYNPIIADSSVSDSIEVTTDSMVQMIKKFRKYGKRTILWAGEPTISIPQGSIETGKGGRISALCTLISEEISYMRNVIFIGIATDGVDGSSPASGYIINYKTGSHLRPLGGARKLINNGNSGLALSSLGYGIELSNTNINLQDIYLAIIL